MKSWDHRWLIALFYLLVMMTANGIAQDYTQTIRGTVKDADSKSELPDAKVYLFRDTTFINGAYTDEEGEFEISGVPIGRYVIKITYIGYEPLEVPNVVVNSGKEVILNLELRESFVETEVVEIIGQERTEAKNEMATVSTRPFTLEEAMRYAGTRNDPARMAMNFAGVSGANDQRNDIIIRGNSPTGVLFRLDGVNIPNPNHFGNFGTTGGPISMLNANLLDNSDFMTGAFPAEYGNALSGVFDLKMRNGNYHKHEFTGQFGFNGLEFMAEGPISKENKSSYLASYRYSNLILFNKLGISFGSSAVPEYQDFSFKVNVPTTGAGTFSVFGLGGLDAASVLDAERSEEDFYGPAGTDIVYSGRIGAVGLTHTLPLDESSYIRTTLSAYHNFTSTEVDSVLRNFPDSTRGFYDAFFTENKLSLNVLYNRKFSSRHTLQVGAFADQLMYDMVDSVHILLTDGFVTLRDFSGKAYFIQPYAQWRFRVTEKLTLNTGIHDQVFLLNGRNTIEPRVGLKYGIGENKFLSAAYGKHSQLQSMMVYFSQVETDPGVFVRPNEDLDFTHAHHYVLAYDQSITKNFKVRLETYFQSLYNVPVDATASSSFSMLNEGSDYVFTFPDSLVNDGTGENYGVELTIEKFFSKRYYFLVTTSVFNSTYKGSDGIRRNTAFNGNYVFNALGGYELTLGKKKNKVLAVNGKVVYAGGRRYTPIDVEASNLAFRAVYLEDQAYSLQFKDYFRTDIRVSLRLNSKKFSQEFAAEVTNLFNTQNPFTLDYNKYSNELYTTYQLGLFPVGQYKIEF